MNEPGKFFSDLPNDTFSARYAIRIKTHKPCKASHCCSRIGKSHVNYLFGNLTYL